VLFGIKHVATRHDMVFNLRPSWHRCRLFVLAALNTFITIAVQADASGTVEAVKSALGALPQDSVLLRFLLAAPNNITTSDIDLAAASEALVVGFNTEPSEEVTAAAKERGAHSTVSASCDDSVRMHDSYFCARLFG
jgi:Translation-initiation factor 2